MKGASYFEISDVLKNKTKYQYFCPKCNHGPFYTGFDNTECPACNSEITLYNIDGDIIVKVLSTKLGGEVM